MIIPDRAPRRHQFESLLDDHCVHAVFTRLGGASQGPFASLNVGRTVGDDPMHIEANHRAVYRGLHAQAEDVVSAQQVHGDRVAFVSPEDRGRVLPGTDALISVVPGLLLLLRFADCVPVLLYAPRQRVVGLVHAGWRGTLQGIAARAARAMMHTHGCEASDILAGIGPAIGPCCYEVGAEVVGAVQDVFPSSLGVVSPQRPDGRAQLDLAQANVLQLREIGVTQVEVAGICTSCQVEEFYSHRREGGNTGRFAVVIGLAPDR